MIAGCRGARFMFAAAVEGSLERECMATHDAVLRLAEKVGHWSCSGFVEMFRNPLYTHTRFVHDVLEAWVDNSALKLATGRTRDEWLNVIEGHRAARLDAVEDAGKKEDP